MTRTSPELETAIPAGFARHFRQSPVTDAWEPLYSLKRDDVIVIGFRSDNRHTNSRGFVHGGVITSLADNAMGLSCGVNLGAAASLITVALSIDFVGTARQSQWIEIAPALLKLGKTLCFAECRVTADNDLCARASATFRVVPRN
jgi:uncharacterized protein (TIGR00369 family)